MKNKVRRSDLGYAREVESIELSEKLSLDGRQGIKDDPYVSG